MVRPVAQYYEFGAFRIDISERLLFRNGENVPLTPKVFDTLLVLVENWGHILTKEEVMNQVWPDTVVEEGNLARNISVLRKALGESPDENQYIETIPWRGYRFVADVRETGTGDADLVLTERTTAHVVIKHDDAPSKTGSTRRFVLLAACAVIAAAAAVVFWISPFGTRDAAPPVIGSIAVLPLENLSGDASQEFFADGITDSLINNLAQIRALRVISRTSAMRYKGTQKPLAEIASELGVDALLTGTVRRVNDRVRVSAQIIHPATDTHIWAQDYERDLSDILRLEGEIAREIAREIRVQTTEHEQSRLASARSVDPQAHEAYLLGRFYLSKNNAQDWEHAIQQFQNAVDIAPDYAEAYAGLSDVLRQQAKFAEKPSQRVVPGARAAAVKAVELNEELADAHTSLGNIYHNYDWNWSLAEKAFERSLELNPASLIAHVGYGHLLHSLGRHDEAVRQGERAVQLDPLSAEAHTALGRFLYRARRYDEALPVLQRAVQLEPRSVGANARLGSVYAALGKYSEALAVYEQAKAAAPSVDDWRDVIAYVYARMGRKKEARQMVSGLKAFPIDVAAVYVALGDKDEAFRVLAAAIEERTPQLVVLNEDPTLQGLHSDPRWNELISRMNFPSN